MTKNVQRNTKSKSLMCPRICALRLKTIDSVASHGSHDTSPNPKIRRRLDRRAYLVPQNNTKGKAKCSKTLGIAGTGFIAGPPCPALQGPST